MQVKNDDDNNNNNSSTSNKGDFSCKLSASLQLTVFPLTRCICPVRQWTEIIDEAGLPNWRRGWRVRVAGICWLFHNSRQQLVSQKQMQSKHWLCDGWWMLSNDDCRLKRVETIKLIFVGTKARTKTRSLIAFWATTTKTTRTTSK